MWQSIEYKGFEIHVCPCPKYDPPQAGAPYSYAGYVRRPGADIHAGCHQVVFSQPLATFSNEEAALEAGYKEGKSITDGTHPELSVKDL